jgi:hypothetical protein
MGRTGSFELGRAQGQGWRRWGPADELKRATVVDQEETHRMGWEETTFREVYS